MVTGHLLAKDDGHVYLLAWVPGYGWLFILFNVKKKNIMHKCVNVIGLAATTR